MKTSRMLCRSSLIVACAIALAPCSRAGLFSAVSESEKLTAVNSSSHNGYVRARQADGSYRPETYAFGNGGILSAAISSDPTIDGMHFDSIVGMLEDPLASQAYVPTREANSTDLLIMVYWGETTGGNTTSDGYMRDNLNRYNARLLGFDTEEAIKSMWDPSTAFWGRSIRSGMISNLHAEVLSAIEVNRYFVILRAYDFQNAWKHKDLKLLWETKFSLSERRHDFERDLSGMAQDAALYFGKDSYGLVLKPIPEGHVHIGAVKAVAEPEDLDGPSAFDPHSGMVGDWKRSSPGPQLIIHVDGDGRTTFESPEQHVVVPARTSTNQGDVAITVPGWGIRIDGKLRGDRFSGSIFQYDHKNSLTLERVAKTDGDASSTARTPSN